MYTVKVDIGGEPKDFQLGTSILLYGPVASGKTTFCLTLAGQFLKNNLPVVWICLDESPNVVREKLEFFKVDYMSFQDNNTLRFIDAYSEQVTGKSLKDPYIINCTSAVNLNELNRALMRALSEVEGRGLVVFDSVSTLLLYNRASTCEEFLKVHLSRITSADFTGLLILQRELQQQQTEETLKMMCDSVLEFGFEKGLRKISVLKLPLGQSGDWIESSLFNWQQQPGLVVSKHTGPRKYMDSGGYIEEFKEGLIEGLRKGLSDIQSGSSAVIDDMVHGKDQSVGSEAQGGKGGTGALGGRGGEGGPGGMGEIGLSEGEQGSGTGSLGQVIRAPTIQRVDKQIIVTGIAQLPEQLSKEVQKLFSEQVRLNETIREKEELTRESKRRLDILLSKESETSNEVREIDERTRTLHKAINEKRKQLFELSNQKKADEARYREAVAKQEAIKQRIDKIIERKKNLENKIQNLVKGEGELYIDLRPYLQEVLAKKEKLVADIKDNLNGIDARRDSLSKEIKILEEEARQASRQVVDKKEELESVRDRKAKVESEINLISQARSETEKRLKDIVGKKQLLESKLRKLEETK